MMFRQGSARLWGLGAACLLGLALVCAPGCGKSKGTVSGTVKMKSGAPVSAGSTVTFWGADNRSYPGQVGAEGKYSIPDVPAGEMKVTVTPPSEGVQTMAKAKLPGETGASKPPPPPTPIPPKYTKQADTPLKFTVQKGSNEINITLE
jgi:hypothetical protein